MLSNKDTKLIICGLFASGTELHIIELHLNFYLVISFQEAQDRLVF